jgi:hypothetical protein
VLVLVASIKPRTRRQATRYDGAAHGFDGAKVRAPTARVAAIGEATRSDRIGPADGDVDVSAAKLLHAPSRDEAQPKARSAHQVVREDLKEEERVVRDEELGRKPCYTLELVAFVVGGLIAPSRNSRARARGLARQPHLTRDVALGRCRKRMETRCRPNAPAIVAHDIDLVGRDLLELAARIGAGEELVERMLTELLRRRPVTRPPSSSSQQRVDDEDIAGRKRGEPGVTDACMKRGRRLRRRSLPLGPP